MLPFMFVFRDRSFNLKGWGRGGLWLFLSLTWAEKNILKTIYASKRLVFLENIFSRELVAEKTI